MKRFTYILAVIAFLAFGPSSVRAEDLTVSGSATFVGETDNTEFDFRVVNLRKFLEKYNSPLAAYSEDFVNLADDNGLDYRLVASISGVESTFGKQIPYNSYNAYGWVNGNYNFKSWPDSIQIVSETLRAKYIEKGAVTIPQIARRYAPPSSTWGTKVKYFVGKIDTLPMSFDI